MDFARGLTKLWKVWVTVIPRVVDALWMVFKDLRCIGWVMSTTLTYKNTICFFAFPLNIRNVWNSRQRERERVEGGWDVHIGWDKQSSWSHLSASCSTWTCLLSNMTPHTTYAALFLRKYLCSVYFKKQVHILLCQPRNLCWKSAQYSTIGKVVIIVRSRKTNRDHPNYSIFEISHDTGQSPGDLKRLADTQSFMENSHGVW